MHWLKFIRLEWWVLPKTCVDEWCVPVSVYFVWVRALSQPFADALGRSALGLFAQRPLGRFGAQTKQMLEIVGHCLNRGGSSRRLSLQVWFGRCADLSTRSAVHGLVLFDLLCWAHFSLVVKKQLVMNKVVLNQRVGLFLWNLAKRPKELARVEKYEKKILRWKWKFHID